MNNIVGDSRAVTLKYYKHKFTELVDDIWGSPGLGLQEIVELIEENIIYNHPPTQSGRSHYYIIGGICDITTRMTAKNYQEVIFNMNDDRRASFINKLDDAANKILKLGVSPIFCTIFPMHLATWNNLRLKQHKTNTLNYQGEYNTMQQKLEEHIDAINSHITQMNSSRHYCTPLLHTNMEKNRRNKKYLHYKLLTDGCHLGEPMKEKIIKSIDRAMLLNKNLH